MEIRIIVLNMRHGEVKDGVIDVELQAKTLKKYEPNIIMLQEMDLFTKRVKQIDELNIFKELTGLKYSSYGSNITFKDGWYGNAILSEFPIISSENYMSSICLKETKGVLHSIIEIGNKQVDIYNTHFPVIPEERIKFAEEIIYLMKRVKNTDKVVLAGDFNLGLIPLSGKHNYKIEKQDKYQELEELKKYFEEIEFNELTYEVGNPIGSIDKVMYKGNLKLISIEKLNEEISDHYPILVKFEI